jgi:two-component system sensor histidine kinase PilS (NtrC family)
LLRWVYLGRTTLAIVMFVAAAFSFDQVAPETIVILAVAAIASSLMSGWSVWYTHVRRYPPGDTFLYTQALFDLVLITTIVHVTEGPASQFPALYIIVIAVFAVIMPLRSSMLVTALASLLYLADIVWLQEVSLTAAVWLQIAVFVGVFLTTGLIASRVQAVGAERAELQEEVRRLKLEASDILGNLQSGVLTVDGEGLLVYANAAARGLLGLGWEDVVGRPLAELLSDRSPALVGVIREIQRRRLKTLRGEGIVRLDDRTYPIGVTTTTLELGGESPPSITAIFSDISDQKRVEELRLRTERLEAVAELSASLAHEIKNPLASIRSSVEQLSRSAHTDDDERFLANLVLRESDRLSNLLSEFLDFSRVRVTASRPVDLWSVAESAAAVVRQHPDCDDDTQIDVQGESANVEGDADLLHRIAVNLLLNAVQACRGPARITVEVREARPGESPAGFVEDKGAVLKVSDGGPGIPVELRDRLFEPFVTGRVGGSGLGLAIVQRAVQAHRGAVFVDSVPREYTTFTVLLPTKATSEVAA